uniref:Uncharacterized protein n=1 Tax=Candidatus Kentrum sp. SD TaxID=2126332 RepID=A0A451BHA3_9GAMM|nr:MAG: hypothetical protein BECKSD772D_GA0070982_10013 [Candidatus Kentron sp. SD]
MKGWQDISRNVWACNASIVKEIIASSHASAWEPESGAPALLACLSFIPTDAITPSTGETPIFFLCLSMFSVDADKSKGAISNE